MVNKNKNKKKRHIPDKIAIKNGLKLLTDYPKILRNDIYQNYIEDDTQCAITYKQHILKAEICEQIKSFNNPICELNSDLRIIPSHILFLENDLSYYSTHWDVLLMKPTKYAILKHNRHCYKYKSPQFLFTKFKLNGELQDLVPDVCAEFRYMQKCLVTSALMCLEELEYNDPNDIDYNTDDTEILDLSEPENIDDIDYIIPTLADLIDDDMNSQPLYFTDMNEQPLYLI